MDQNFVQGLHNLLTQSTSNDTGVLRAATAQLNTEYYTKPECISALATILASSPEQPIRQLAAVEMRKRINAKNGDFWTQVPQTDRTEIKNKLPEIIVADNSNLVRHSTARVIAAIAAIEIPLKAWPQLLPIVHQTCTSQNHDHREAGSYILYTVLENVDAIMENFSEFLVMVELLLADPVSLEVRVNAVKSLGILASWVDLDNKQQIKSVQALVPGMLQVLGFCVEHNEESASRRLFDVLESMLILEVPVLSKHIPELVQFLLRTGGDLKVDSDIRGLILNGLQWTVSYKKSKVQSQNLAPSILEHIMPITAEEEPEDPDDDSPSRCALRIIDTLSTKLPPTQVFPTLKQLILQYYGSTDPSFRRGAMLALGVSVEGCSEYMTPLMDQVWPVIEAGLNDSDPTVRGASCTAVCCLCDWLDDTVAAKHETLLPTLMNLINDDATQKRACTALDSVLEIMQDNIGQYLQLIMERLVVLLETAPLPVKAVVTGAIGSAAHASKDGFLPYFQPTMDRVKHFLLLTGEGEEAELRGLTMDAIGTFAEAVGKDVFRPYVGDMMQQAITGVQSGQARLRECSFLFFNVMARLFGSEFSPYLPTVVPSLIASCKQDEGGEGGLEISLAEATAAFASGSDPSNAISVTDGAGSGMKDEEIEDIDLDKFLEVNNAIAVEKEIAADTIGVIFSATGQDFQPYLEAATMALIELTPHYYEGIRKSATESLLEILRTSYKLAKYPEWTPGIAVEHPLENPVKSMVNHIFPAIMLMYESEDDKGVAAASCVSLAETIQLIGPAILEGRLEELCNVAIQILEQKAYCQQDPDQDADEEEAPEEQAEEESVLISAAEDLVSAIANALGENFEQAFHTFFPLISNYYKPTRSLSDRSSAIGCLSEIIAGMKTAVSPSTRELMELFYRALGDEDGEVCSNAAFATGLLIEHSERDLSAQYPQLLLALNSLFNVAGDSGVAKLKARDNAVGAVARMILKNTAAVPLEQILPVLVSNLPLKADTLENGPTFEAILHLYQTNPLVIGAYTQQLLLVFKEVLDPESPSFASEEIRGQLVQLISLLNAENPSIIQAAGLSSYIS